MTSFGQELLGGRGFSLIPPEGLHAIISVNPRLLLPTKFVVAYARKQSKSTIFEWKEKEKWWYLYAGEYPVSWEKKVRVLNLPVLAKKGLMSWTAKPKLAKRGDDSFETYFDIVPYEGDLPLIGNIALESSSLPSAFSYSSRRFIASKRKPLAPRPTMDAPPFCRTRGSKRKTSPPPPFAIFERRVYYL